MTKARNYGIDLMRILCMLMIVVYHMLGYGSIITHPGISQKGFLLCRLLQAACFTAVNGYALISGYVGIHARYRYSQLAALWLRVFFYSAGLTLVMALVMPGSVTLKDAASSLFPIISGRYWYFTAYAACFALIPLARAAVEKLSRKQMGAFLAAALIVYSLIPTLVVGDPFMLGKGYDGLWLLLMYALGAYIKKYDLFNRISPLGAALIFAGSILVTCFGGYVREHVMLFMNGEKSGYGWLLRNDSPTMVIGAVSMLLFCARLRISRGQKLIAALAPLCFSVYLIHEHTLFHTIMRTWNLYRIAELRTVLIVPSVLLVALGVYAVCSAIDLIRHHLFLRLSVSQRLAALESKWIGNLWDE